MQESIADVKSHLPWVKNTGSLYFILRLQTIGVTNVGEEPV